MARLKLRYIDLDEWEVLKRDVGTVRLSFEVENIEELRRRYGDRLEEEFEKWVQRVWYRLSEDEFGIVKRSEVGDVWIEDNELVVELRLDLKRVMAMVRENVYDILAEVERGMERLEL